MSTNPQKNDRPISKEEIRDLTEHWIVSGLSAREMADKRAELALETGIPLQALRSISAYARYPATRALKVADLEDRVSRDDLIFLSRYLRDLQALPEYDLHIHETAHALGVCPRSLRYAVEFYEDERNRKPTGKPDTQVLPDHTPELQEEPTPCSETLENTSNTPTASSETCEPAGIVDELGTLHAPSITFRQPPAAEGPDEAPTSLTGDLVNYDFPEKHEWRKWWSNIIREEFGPKRLKTAKVVCLPGRAVEPEVSKYLEMGISANNIFCVEGSPQVRSEFLANAERLGVRAYPMELKDALLQLGKSGHTFDIVNFDFHGPFSRKQHRALVAVPLSNDAIIIYNALAKREPKVDQERLRRASSGFESWTQQLHEVAVKQNYWDMHWVRRIANQGVNEDGTPHSKGSVADLRTSVVKKIALSLTGCIWQKLDRQLMLDVLKAYHRRYDETSISTKTDRQIRRMISGGYYSYQSKLPIGMEAVLAMLKSVSDIRIFKDCDPKPLGEVLWHSMFGDSYWVNEVRTHHYWSQANWKGARSPFRSTCGRLRKPESVMANHRPALLFCSALIAAWYRVQEERKAGASTMGNIKLGVISPDGRVLPNKPVLQVNHRVKMMHETVGTWSISVGALRHAMVTASRLPITDGIHLNRSSKRPTMNRKID